jgi:hypothetical protein
MLEAWWCSLKHRWLYLHQLDNIATVRRLVEFYVTELSPAQRLRYHRITEARGSHVWRRPLFSFPSPPDRTSRRNARRRRLERRARPPFDAIPRDDDAGRPPGHRAVR